MPPIENGRGIIKTFPLNPYLLQGKQALPKCKPVSVGHPCDVRYTTPSHHPTTSIVGGEKSVKVRHDKKNKSVSAERMKFKSGFKNNVWCLG